jgi:hypothetical protein
MEPTLGQVITWAKAAGQIALGAAVPRFRDPYWHPEGKLRGMADFVRGRFGPPPEDLLAG